MVVEKAAGSVHVVIGWKWSGRASKVDGRWEVKGWALKERLDKEKEEGRKRWKEKVNGRRKMTRLQGVWQDKSGVRRKRRWEEGGNPIRLPLPDPSSAIAVLRAT